MRLAVVSDIHGNLTALEAVLRDLKETSPDLVLHGGDLADTGASPADVVDCIRGLGWEGVIGNTDEMLTEPETLEEFARDPWDSLKPMFAAIREMAQASREALGEERLAWLRGLPRLQVCGPVALVHASPDSTWRAPALEATDADLRSAFAVLKEPAVIYGHIHRAYVRRVGDRLFANSGSAGMPYDGDPRAIYLVLDNFKASIRRVAYDVDREVKALSVRNFPHAGWIAHMLRTAPPQPFVESS